MGEPIEENQDPSLQNILVLDFRLFLVFVQLKI